MATPYSQFSDAPAPFGAAGGKRRHLGVGGQEEEEEVLGMDGARRRHSRGKRHSRRRHTRKGGQEKQEGARRKRHTRGKRHTRKH